jgi:hypothetical protein
MDRRTRNLFALVLIAVIAITGAAAILGATGANGPVAPSGTTPIVGVIVGVEAQGLDKVTGFTLRTTDRGSLVFTLGQLENGSQFPPGHLVEHQATAQPVRVWYRTEGDVLVAIRLEDAP